MTTYRIEMMDKASMHEYYSGGWNFSVTKIWVEAETKEEAKAKAQAENPNMVINNYIVTKEEIEAEEAAKAAEMGLTVEEYNEYKKEAAKARRYEREAANLEKYIEEETKRVKEEIEWRKRKAAKIKTKLRL